ncbi:prepilin peptidase [Candidatus Saccharibacteria bacterium]|nr:prepilin peptidase [Candidatus Saccharibacteria bacterium]
MVLTSIILGVLGLVAGSFVNAVVWRVRQQELKPKNKLSILTGRSQCPNCGHQLAPKDLVPVLSWLALRGRCRYCQRPISPQYPLVEIAGGLVFGLSYIYWPGGVSTIADWLQLAGWLLSSVGLLALLVFDLRWLILPNKIIYPTLLAASAGRLVYITGFESRPWQALGGWLLAVLVASGFFWLLYAASKGQWIGFGDVRLGLIIGSLVAGPAEALATIIVASVIGSALVIPLLLSGRKHLGEKVAFGPLLIAATWLVVLFGGQLIDWYQRLLA